MTMGEVDAQDEAAPAQVPWRDVCNRLKMDARAELLLRLFQDRFNVQTSIEAFTQIPTFLGDYMVKEFDYRDFSITLGTIDEASADDVSAWTAHLSKNLTGDLVAASTLMLRLAVTVAKANQLEASDWKDINEACSNAVRTLPACYRLQRALPGALSSARAWRHLPHGPEEEAEARGSNPWESEESQQEFEDMHNFPWARVEAICDTDKEVLGVIGGRFQVVEVSEHDGITFVTVEVLRVGVCPSDFPLKTIVGGEVLLWEVESALGSMLEPGFFLECDFYEVHSNTCFMSGLRSITPEWVP